MARSMRSLVRPLVVLAVLGAGCGADDPEVSVASSTTVAPVDASTTTTSTVGASSTSIPDPSTTQPPTTLPPATTTTDVVPVPVPDVDLPGEAFDLTPGEGALLAVVGVRFDDLLNVRRIPGTAGEVIAALTPTSADTVATGRARLLDRSIWWEVVTADGVLGWVNARYTAQAGPTFDTTSAVIDRFGARPEAATIEELGILVAEAVPRDPDVPSAIVVTAAPDESGDVWEVTIDVVGLGDDAVRAVRVHVLGDPADTTAGVALRAVEQTDMCDSVRGPSEPDGLCA